ncbi:MAG: T9SS type A sorting domain-containing protein [Saprospiraceae bacterium]|nr:T9SS type A sorting domain-containing protein [Saprospiraceae bacterium]
MQIYWNSELFPSGTEVLTYWTTENEIDVKSYYVERSIDAKSWKEIGSINAENANTGNRYELLDDQPFNGESFYRLKRHDTDGKTEYSGIVSVNLNLNTELIIFPNPARHMLTINLEDEEENVQIDIRDINGKTVFSEYLNSKISRNLDVSHLRSGNYFVELRTDNKVITKHLIKL